MLYFWQDVHQPLQGLVAGPHLQGTHRREHREAEDTPPRAGLGCREGPPGAAGLGASPSGTRPARPGHSLPGRLPHRRGISQRSSEPCAAETQQSGVSLQGAGNQALGLRVAHQGPFHRVSESSHGRLAGREPAPRGSQALGKATGLGQRRGRCHCEADEGHWIIAASESPRAELLVQPPAPAASVGPSAALLLLWSPTLNFACGFSNTPSVSDVGKGSGMADICQLHTRVGR